MCVGILITRGGHKRRRGHLSLKLCQRRACDARGRVHGMSLSGAPAYTRRTIEIWRAGGIGICRLAGAVACGGEFEGATTTKSAAGTVTNETSNEFLRYPVKRWC